MGKRDAFGREIGEDPLADLGWQRAPEPPRTQPAPNWVAPQPAPAPAPAKPAPTAFDAGEAWSVRGTPEPRQAPPPRPRASRRRRRRGFSRLIFVLVVLVIAGASVGSLFELGSDAVDRGQRALRDAIPTAPPVTRTEPGAKLEGSLLAPATLRKALAQLPPGRVTILTVRQDGLDATLTAGGNTTLVHMTADGEMTTVDAHVAIPGKSVKLDRAAPGRIVRTVTRRTGRSPSSISQLVLANGSWTLQFPDGVQFTANAKGTKVRRIT